MAALEEDIRTLWAKLQDTRAVNEQLEREKTRLLEKIRTTASVRNNEVSLAAAVHHGGK